VLVIQMTRMKHLLLAVLAGLVPLLGLAPPVFAQAGRPTGPTQGRVVGATYVNRPAGYTHQLPPSWISHGYKWYEYWGPRADQVRAGAAFVADWVYVPMDAGKPEARLVTVAVYPADVWQSLAAQGGPPPGEALAATERWVYAWSGRQDAPYGDGSPDEQQATALYADAHVLVDTFRLLPSAGRAVPLTPSLVGPTWAWIGLVGTAPASQFVVPDPQHYTLRLTALGTYDAQADCNLLSGRYTLQGSSLTLEPGPTTLAVCPPPTLSDQYVLLLGQVESYGFEGPQLVLTLQGGAGRMTFRAAPAERAP
jgi:heat shock protein HslJ